MLTVSEVRRARLEQLIERHNGRLADLNEALGYERTSAKLARIRNANARKERDGKTFQMGDTLAREIEEKLNLERGFMDTPVEFELGSSTTGRQLLDVFRRIPAEERATALRLLDALAESPKAKTGTHG